MNRGVQRWDSGINDKVLVQASRSGCSDGGGGGAGVYSVTGSVWRAPPLRPLAASLSARGCWAATDAFASLPGFGLRPTDPFMCEADRQCEGSESV